MLDLKGEWNKKKSQVILNTTAPLTLVWNSYVHSMSLVHQTGKDEKNLDRHVTSPVQSSLCTDRPHILV